MSSTKKQSVWRSKEYLDMVRGMHCCVCGWFPPVDPHHIKGYAHITGGGLSRKPDDSWVIPLCHAHHTQLHDQGWKTWEKGWGVSQLDLVRETRSHFHEYLQEHYYNANLQYRTLP